MTLPGAMQLPELRRSFELLQRVGCQTRGRHDASGERRTTARFTVDLSSIQAWSGRSRAARVPFGCNNSTSAAQQRLAVLQRIEK
jgi:hypothetical protein